MNFRDLRRGLELIDKICTNQDLPCDDVLATPEDCRLINFQVGDGPVTQKLECVATLADGSVLMLGYVPSEHENVVRISAEEEEKHARTVNANIPKSDYGYTYGGLL